MLFDRASRYRLAQDQRSDRIPVPQDQNNNSEKECNRDCEEGPEVDARDVRPSVRYRLEIFVGD